MMKKLKPYLLLFLFCMPLLNQAQQDSTMTENKSIFGIQTGFLGIWAHNESALSSEWYLRSEVGLNFGFGGGGSYNEFNNTIALTEGYGAVASVSLEPRFYYNLEKRKEKGKNVLANSANFIAFNVNYYPGLLIAAQNRDEVGYTHQISFTPYWGIKRTVFNHLTYEAGAGLGYLHNFSEKGRDFIYGFDQNALYIQLHLRIGYTF